jgi:pilus assembly protein CpaF
MRRSATDIDQLAAEYASAIVLSGFDATNEDDVAAYLAEHGIADRRLTAKIVALTRGRIAGFGPLTPLMFDDEVRDIAVNGPDDVWALRPSGWEPVPSIRFGSTGELMEITTRLVAATGVGIALTRETPVVDARLKDGGPRICAAIPPATDGGPKLTIRKYRRQRLSLKEYVESGAMSVEMAAILFAAVRARLNLLISGGTGSGKTTLLAALLDIIPPTERLVLIEDTRELPVDSVDGERWNVVPLIAERNGRLSAAEQLKNSLRMSPDRIIVGEVRGGEALVMLQAMNTGHEGSMSSIHANGAAEALIRLETLAMMSGIELPLMAIRGQIAAAIDLVVHVARNHASGRYTVVEMAEVVWGEQGPVAEPIFLRSSDGTFHALRRPTFYPRLLPHLPSKFRDPFPKTAERDLIAPDRDGLR